MLVACLVVVTAANKFFNSIMGRRRNELYKTLPVEFLKLNIFAAVQDLIISFNTQKVSLFKCPPFWPMLPHLVCSGDGTGTGNQKFAGSTLDY